MKLRFTLLCIAAVFFLTNCHKNVGEKETIVEVEKEFSLQPWEQLDENGGRFQLRVATLATQECGGTRVNYYASIVGYKAVVTLRSLAYPALCGASEPAHDTIDVGGLQQNATYEFQINLKDVVFNKGTLYVEPDKYTLEMQKEDGISLSTKQVLRVPQGAVWGFIGNDAAQDKLGTQLLDSLKTVAPPLSMSNGNYGYFNVNGTGFDIYAPFSTTKPNIRRFLLRLNGSRDELVAKLNKFRSSGLECLLFTSDGKTFKL